MIEFFHAPIFALTFGCFLASLAFGFTCKKDGEARMFWFTFALGIGAGLFLITSLEFVLFLLDYELKND